MRPILLALFTSMFAGILVAEAAAVDKPEPKYEGKPLAYWVERFRKCENKDDRYDAYRALEAFGADASPATAELVEMLDDRSRDFCRLAAGVLKRMGPAAKAAVPELVRSLKEKTARNPDITIGILDSLGPDAKEAIPALIPYLDESEFRCQTIEALCSIGEPSKEVMQAIARAIKAEKNGSYCVYDLRKFGGDAVPLLLELMELKSEEFKTRCASTLGDLGPPAKKAVPELTRLLKNQSHEVQGEAAMALWKIDKNTDGVKVLAEQLKQFPNTDAYRSAPKLAEIGPAAKEALPFLEKCYRTFREERYVYEEVKAVKEAIRKIDPELADKLSKELEEDRNKK